jgi:hypothetical protein
MLMSVSRFTLPALPALPARPRSTASARLCLQPPWKATAF